MPLNPNPLATERFRTIVADAIGGTPVGGRDGQSPDVVAVVGAFPNAHFEYQTNGAGVRLRRVAVASDWEAYPLPEGVASSPPESMDELPAPASTLPPMRPYAPPETAPHPFKPGWEHDRCGHLTEGLFVCGRVRSHSLHGDSPTAEATKSAFCLAPMGEGKSMCHLDKGHAGRHRSGYPAA